MNTSQFHLSNWQGQGPVWAIPIFFGYLSEHSHSHTALILLLEILPATCILLPVCFHGLSYSNVSLVHLINRTVSGNHM